jgi:hypothetical protein
MLSMHLKEMTAENFLSCIDMGLKFYLYASRIFLHMAPK